MNVIKKKKIGYLQCDIFFTVINIFVVCAKPSY